MKLAPSDHTQLRAISVFEAEVGTEIPVIKASLAGTRLVGRLSVGALYVCLRELLSLTSFWFAGNRHGLLLPTSATDQGVE